jgi:hypothetical protein
MPHKNLHTKSASPRCLRVRKLKSTPKLPVSEKDCRVAQSKLVVLSGNYGSRYPTGSPEVFVEKLDGKEIPGAGLTVGPPLFDEELKMKPIRNPRYLRWTSCK